MKRWKRALVVLSGVVLCCGTVLTALIFWAAEEDLEHEWFTKGSMPQRGGRRDDALHFPRMGRP